MFETVNRLKFFRNDLDLTELPALPLSEITIKRGARFLQIQYKSETFSLAVCADGLLYGVAGELTPTKRATLLIVRIGAFSFRIFDAREITDEQVEEELLKMEQKEERPPMREYSGPAKGI